MNEAHVHACIGYNPFANMKIPFDERPLDLKRVTCPRCGAPFMLVWNDYSKSGHPALNELRQTLLIKTSAVVVQSISIRCPHCDYEEAL
jgi:hypothetical protein